MTQMAPSRTALRGMWPLLVLSNLFKRPADLNGGHPVFVLSKSGQKMGGESAPGTKTKTQKLKLGYIGHPYNLYFPQSIPLQILKMHKGRGEEALAQSPRR